jgi:nucleoside-diphosphate-sugar epimerase
VIHLVTGASGILGSYVVVELIKQGANVVACHRAGSSLQLIQNIFALTFSDWETQFKKIVWRELDITNLLSIEEALQGIDVVYHCAGFVSFSSANREKLFRINEEGTANLVNVCLSKPEIEVCHVSSIGTLNNSEYRGQLNESVFWKSTGREGAYAISKYNAEREVWRGIEEGLKAVIVNPGVILAPPFWEQSSLELIHKAYRGNRFYTHGQTAYVMAEDVAAVMVKLMNLKLFGKRFLVFENNYTYKAVFTALRDGFHYKTKLIAVSRPVLNAISLLERFVSFFIGREPVLSPSVLRAAFNQQTYSRDTLDQVLKHDFIPVPTGIAKLCDVYLKQRPLAQAKSSGSGA